MKEVIEGNQNKTEKRKVIKNNADKKKAHEGEKQ